MGRHVAYHQVYDFFVPLCIKNGLFMYFFKLTNVSGFTFFILYILHKPDRYRRLPAENHTMLPIGHIKVEGKRGSRIFSNLPFCWKVSFINIIITLLAIGVLKSKNTLKTPLKVRTYINRVTKNHKLSNIFNNRLLFQTS